MPPERGGSQRGAARASCARGLSHLLHRACWALLRPPVPAAERSTPPENANSRTTPSRASFGQAAQLDAARLLRRYCDKQQHDAHWRSQLALFRLNGAFRSWSAQWVRSGVGVIYTGRRRRSALRMLSLVFFFLPMARLTDLPDELLALILSHLPRRPARSALAREEQRVDNIAALRCTSRRLYRVADPLLDCVIYERYRFKVARPSELQRWAWKVARNPGCARFVKEIHLAQWPPRPSGRADGMPTAEQFENALASSGSASATHSDLIGLLGAQSEAACLAFLLLTCSRLEVFAGRAVLDDLGPTLRSILVPNGGSGGWPVLHLPVSICTLKLGSEWSPLSVDEVLPLLRLPRLRELTILRLSDARSRSAPLPLEARAQQPINLVFEDCFLSGAGLATILASCARPRSLRARWLSFQKDAFYRRAGAGRCAARLAAIDEESTNADVGAAIRQHGASLQHLHLDTTDLYARCRDDAPSFGSFASLHGLRTLRIPLYGFCQPEPTTGTSTLPSSLRNLCILGYARGELPLHDYMLDSVMEVIQVTHPRMTTRKAPWSHLASNAAQQSGSCVLYPQRELHGDLGGELGAWDWASDHDIPTGTLGSSPDIPIWLRGDARTLLQFQKCTSLAVAY